MLQKRIASLNVQDYTLAYILSTKPFKKVWFDNVIENAYHLFLSRATKNRNECGARQSFCIMRSVFFSASHDILLLCLSFHHSIKSSLPIKNSLSFFVYFSSLGLCSLVNFSLILFIESQPSIKCFKSSISIPTHLQYSWVLFNIFLYLH